MSSGTPNKRIEQNARRPAARRQVGRACSCAMRWADERDVHVLSSLQG
jgi:hypothetical protein